ncbi:MAG: UDP-2,3-diacylglucosamine diphosphatase [Bacteriovoracaceae bacterium]|jgi:UDP-2,3-diacylglucosamine hydrolase|nr:UDP-2,3-diacylglucosamine diphosphatase [Bacteriovoracaceae bacterium]
MQISSISDIHIKLKDDIGYRILCRFLSSQTVIGSDYIVLAGDIFDLMVGDKKQYLQEYSVIFDMLKNILFEGKKIIYIEGNHDFHISKMLRSFFNSKNFIPVKGYIVLRDGERKIYVSHGDEVDYTDLAYLRWKKIYSLKCFSFFVNTFLPYHFIKWVGDRASKNSRKRGKKKFNYEKAKKKYLRLLCEFQNIKGYDYYILGHTHIKVLTDNVINNGFPIEHGLYSFYDNGVLELKEII